MPDAAAFVLFAAVLGAAVGAGEALRAWAGWPADATRRVVHALVGLATAASLSGFRSPALIYVLAGVFVAGNGVALARGWFPGMHGTARRSVGTVLFPLALALCLVAGWTWGADRVFAVQAAFAVLALADPAASLVGARARRFRYAVGRGTKSAAGSLTFALVAGAVTGASLSIGRPAAWGGGEVALAALTVALVGAAAESVGRDGWDNLTVPLAVVVALVALERAVEAGDAARFAWALAAGVAFAGATWRVGALDVSGALAGALLAWALVAVGGVVWAAPALTFFVPSAALSRLPGGDRRDAGGRTAGQVLANGGVGLALLALWAVRPADDAWGIVLWTAFASSFAAAAADTWATEIGTRYGGVPRRLGFGRRLTPGESGGVTLTGTLASVAGAASVGLAVMLASGSPWMGAGLIVAGVAGAAVDTLLGATLQARFRASDGAVVETAGDDAPLVSGVQWMTNGAVNLACTATGAAVGAPVGLLVWFLHT